MHVNERVSEYNFVYKYVNVCFVTLAMSGLAVVLYTGNLSCS